MRKKLLSIFLLFLFPLSVFAYSNQVIVGGETIGIEVHSQGVYVVGFYEVNQQSIGEKAGFRIGDQILEINHIPVDSIASFNSILSSEEDYQFTILRGKKQITINLPVILEDSFYKTGLYVKDHVYGIGTLSYIDPETKVFGSLGHEILESNSKQKFQILDGDIYKAEVSSILKSTRGSTGEKNAKIAADEDIGSIYLNEEVGVFGIYEDSLSNEEKMDVALPSEIHKGNASLRTVLHSNEVMDYRISIVRLDESSPSKNIFFEITDPILLEKSGGIVQGMSGSPILQDNKIIGVVNYVVVDQPNKGYGVFITKMLEEGDKILS